MGIIISYTKPGLVEQAQTMVTNKLNEGFAIIPLAMLCNAMIFVAVSCWTVSVSPAVRVFGLVFATMVFVYCGFEHCIANAFYFGLGRNACSLLSAILFLLANAMWNGVGGIIARRILEESATYDYKSE
jgi:formate/nitrite transporter FocA (FNT family)